MGSIQGTSIIIPSKNNSPGLRRLLPVLKAQKGCGEIDIIVVDNESTDDTARLVTGSGCRLLTVPDGEFNHGLARDLGVGEARHEFVVLTVSDALPLSDKWASGLVRHLEGEGIAGSYGLQVPHPDAPAHAWQEYWYVLSASGGRPRIQRVEAGCALEDLGASERNMLVQFDNVTSALRRSVWKDLPFGRTVHAEDMQWARKVIERGFGIVFEPGSAVLHSHDRDALYEFRRTLVDSHMRSEISGYQKGWLYLPSLLRLPLDLWRVRSGRVPLPDAASGPRISLASITKGLKVRGCQVAGNLAFFTHKKLLHRVGPIDDAVGRILDEYS